MLKGNQCVSLAADRIYMRATSFGKHRGQDTLCVKRERNANDALERAVQLTPSVLRICIFHFYPQTAPLTFIYRGVTVPLTLA